MKKLAVLAISIGLGCLHGQVAGGRIHGQIVGDHGRAVHGEVLAVVQAGAIRINVFPTDGQGAFAFDLPSGPVLLVARADGHVSAEKQVFVRPGPANPAMQFRLSPAGVVSGRVFDANGSPAPYARVSVTYPGETRSWRFEDESGASSADAQGYFTLSAVAQGRPFLLHAEAEDRLPSSTGPLTLRGPQMQGAVLMAGRPGLIVRGKVTDSSGNAVRGAIVNLRVEPDEQEFRREVRESISLARLTNKTVQSGPDGSYTFTAVPGGRITITAEAAGRHAAGEARIAGTPAEIILVLR